MTKKNELGVAERLLQLYRLQLVDSSIDELLQLKGELPNEVNDLEDEIAGLHTRSTRLENKLKELQQTVADHNINIKVSEDAIEKYNQQLKVIKNNREYDSLNKEIEDQSLNIQISRINRDKVILQLDEAKVMSDSTKPLIDQRTTLLANKRVELEKITEKTDKEEEKLRKRVDKYRKDIEERLLGAYDKVRASFRNGLSVVTIQRSSCGGCFNVIPPQIQLEIGLHKRIIACEHCGRVIIDETIRKAALEGDSATVASVQAAAAALLTPTAE